MKKDYIVMELESAKGFDQKNPSHCFDLYGHTMAVVKGVEPENDEELTLAAMLHDIGKMSCFTEADGVRKFIGHAKESARLAEQILAKAGCSEDAIKRVTWLVAEHETDLSSRKSMKKRLEAAGELQVRKLLKLRRADILGQAPEVQEEHMQKVIEAERVLEELLAEASGPRKITVKDLAVCAKDLMAIGLKGPEIGNAQREILAEVGAERLRNDRETIMVFLQNRR